MTERFDGHGDGTLGDDDVLVLKLCEAMGDVLPHLGDVTARAKRAFTWRTIDEDLLTAELMFDSARSAVPSSTRDEAGNGSRVLVFTTELRTVEIEVLSDRVVGQFMPTSTGEVQVEGDGGVLVTVPVDDLGFFVIEPVPAGVVRLRCTTPTTRIVTGWVCL